jgi:hypothetical protein
MFSTALGGGSESSSGEAGGLPPEGLGAEGVLLCAAAGASGGEVEGWLAV